MTELQTGQETEQLRLRLHVRITIFSPETLTTLDYMLMTEISSCLLRAPLNHKLSNEMHEESLKWKKVDFLNFEASNFSSNEEEKEENLSFHKNLWTRSRPTYTIRDKGRNELRAEQKKFEPEQLAQRNSKKGPCHEVRTFSTAEQN